jgi:NADPH:quinone reductase-like Zn-dependent oxidoreductase
MQVAGIRRIGDRVEIIEVSELRPLAGDEVLLEVMAAGVGNWDEFVRTGGWDVGARPPMALGVEAAGTVMAAGQAVSDWAPGDPAMIVVAKASGTTRRSSLAMGTLRRHAGSWPDARFTPFGAFPWQAGQQQVANVGPRP